jgi:hypothetical protein
MLTFSFSAVFADVITETPEVFSFKLESATNKEAKFSFGVDNRKSNISKYNYVLKLEKKGEIVEERVYRDSLSISPGDVGGELLIYKPEKEFSADRAILYLTDSAGTVLSLDILGNLELNFKGVGSGSKKAPDCNYEYEADRVNCVFTDKIDKIDSVDLKLYKDSVYGVILSEETISDGLEKDGKKLSFNLKNLKPGFYALKIKMDGYNEEVIEFRKDGIYSDINLAIIKKTASKKGEKVNLEIDLTKGNAVKMQVAVLGNSKDVCASKEFILTENREYNLILNKDCHPASITAYLSDSQGKVLAQYGDEVKSSELIQKIAENNKKINLMNSGVDIFSKNLIALAVIIIGLIISLVLFFARFKKVGAILFVLFGISGLFFFSYGKASAATITNNL